MKSFATMLLVGLGGAVGTVARYWIALLTLPLSRSMPWGTIGINIAGSFVIGFAGTLTLAGGRHPMPEPARLFIMVGVCGGFTTFSSFSLQSLDLIRNGAWNRALLNVGISVVCCLLAVAAGHSLASWLNGGAKQIAQTTTEEEAG